MRSIARISSGKLYEVVASVIRHRIRDGTWQPNSQLPNLDALALEFSVSNITVRQALRELEQEGLILRRQGIGTFVAPTNGNPDLLLWLESSWGGMIHATDPIEITQLENRRELQLDGWQIPDDQCAPAYRFIKRLHSINGQPFAMVDVLLDDALYRRAPGDFERRRVIHVLQGFPDVTLCDARQYLTIGVADIDVTASLHIPLGAPVGKLRRVLVDQHGVAILVAKVIYPGDLVRLEMALQPQGTTTDRA